MECKNCQQTLSQEDSYCRDCGATLVQRRLTMKYFWTEIRDGFFNIDSNRPLLTFLHLFTKPEVVIEGYIQGTRKKYINAFGYFTIAITFSSFFYFVIKRLFPDVMEAIYRLQDTEGVEAEFMKTVMDTIYEYQTFLFFLMIPVFALLSWAVFYNRKRHNYAEHLVLNLYAYSHASIISVLLYFLTIWNLELFTMASMGALLIQLVFYMYVLKRLYQLTIKQLFIKTLFFLAVLLPIYIFFVLIFIVVLIAMGGFDQFIEMQRAKNEVTYIASSVMNWTS
jgi:hypothetical protein